jgi:hypothetical protein
MYSQCDRRRFGGNGRHCFSQGSPGCPYWRLGLARGGPLRLPQVLATSVDNFGFAAESDRVYSKSLVKRCVFTLASTQALGLEERMFFQRLRLVRRCLGLAFGRNSRFSSTERSTAARILEDRSHRGTPTGSAAGREQTRRARFPAAEWLKRQCQHDNPSKSTLLLPKGGY